MTDMIAGLLLAAGAGTRMGGPKALVRFRGELLVDRGVRLLQEAGCSPVHVVLGAACEDVLRQSTLLGPPADVIRPARQARPAPPGGTAGSAHRSDAVVQAGDAGSVEESRPQDGRPQDGQPQGRRTQESRTQESRSQGVRFLEGRPPLWERSQLTSEAPSSTAAPLRPSAVPTPLTGPPTSAARRTKPVVVHNQEWWTGMGSSLRAGLASLPDDVSAVVVALVDQPLVGVEAVRRLRSSASKAPAAVATYEGRPRNPVLLARAVWPGVVALATGDTGARAWLRAHPDLVRHVPCDDTGSAVDLDTPGDVEAYATD